MKARRFIETASRPEMGERDPGVTRIPKDRRNRAESENEQEQIKIRPAKFTAQAADEQEHEQNGYQLEGVGKLAEKSETDEQAGQRPPPGKIRRAFERQPERVERRHPEKDRERIDRQHEAAEIEDGRDIERDHGPEAGQ